MGTADPGLAAITARRTASNAAATGTWKLDARGLPGDTTTGLPLTLSGISTKHVLYFSLVNFGSLDLRSATLRLTITKGQQSPATTFAACIGGDWNETTDVCSGTATPLFVGAVTAPTETPFATTVVPTASGANLRIKVDSTLPGTTVTISVAVASPTDVRAPVTLST